MLFLMHTLDKIKNIVYNLLKGERTMRSELITRFAEKFDEARRTNNKKLFEDTRGALGFALLTSEEYFALKEKVGNLNWEKSNEKEKV